MFTVYANTKETGIERAQFFRTVEKRKGVVREIITELNFLLERPSSGENRYWIEIQRTVVFTDQDFDKKDAIIDLGLNNIQINQQVFTVSNTTQKNVRTEGNKAYQTIRIPITEKIFDFMMSATVHTYQIDALNFTSKPFTLNKAQSNRFIRELQDMKAKHKK